MSLWRVACSILVLGHCKYIYISCLTSILEHAEFIWHRTVDGPIWQDWVIEVGQGQGEVGAWWIRLNLLVFFPLLSAFMTTQAKSMKKISTAFLKTGGKWVNLFLLSFQRVYCGCKEKKKSFLNQGYTKMNPKKADINVIFCKFKIARKLKVWMTAVS